MCAHDDASASTLSTRLRAWRINAHTESIATRRSMPVPTSGASSAHERHGLTLHVWRHERAVRVVVLEEGHESRGHDTLVRRHVHQLHLPGVAMRVAVQARSHECCLNLPFSSMVDRRGRDVLASSSRR